MSAAVEQAPCQSQAIAIIVPKIWVCGKQRKTGPKVESSFVEDRGKHSLFCCLQAVPLLSVIEDMIHHRQGGINARMVPATVRLIWTAREREEFTLISESIMAAAG